MSDRIRLLASYGFAAALLAVIMLAYLDPATPAFAECKPDGLPDFAGNAVPGQLDPAIENPSGGNYYGNYGWSGLKWYTCDIQDVGALTPDLLAVLDTWFGNAFMGFAVLLGSIMTALHKWMAEPSAAFAGIDEKITQLSDITIELFFSDWATAAFIFAGITIIAAAITKNIRSVGITFGAAVAAAAFVSVVGYAPLQIAQSTDGVASSIVSAADQSALALVGIPESGGGAGEISATPEEATGAVLNDALLQPFWRLGQTGSVDWMPTTDAMFTSSTVAWEQVGAGYDPEEVADDYDEAVQEVRDDEELAGQYQTIKGQSYNRAGAGAMAMYVMFVIGVIRIPAEALIFLGMLVIRFIPILGPIFALLAIIPQTRGAATAALKVVAASVYNVIVFGVIAAVHTGITALLYVGAENLFVATLVSSIVTYLLWQLSKPFRSVTKLATGEAVAKNLADAPEAPGKAFKNVIGMATGTVMGHVGHDALQRRRGKKGDDEPRISRADRAHPGAEQPLVHPDWAVAPRISPAWDAQPAAATQQEAGSWAAEQASAREDGKHVVTLDDGTIVIGEVIDNTQYVDQAEHVVDVHNEFTSRSTDFDNNDDFFVPDRPWQQDEANAAFDDGIWLPARGGDA